MGLVGDGIGTAGEEYNFSYGVLDKIEWRELRCVEAEENMVSIIKARDTEGFYKGSEVWDSEKQNMWHLERDSKR